MPAFAKKPGQQTLASRPLIKRAFEGIIAVIHKCIREEKADRKPGVLCRRGADPREASA